MIKGLGVSNTGCKTTQVAGAESTQQQTMKALPFLAKEDP